jgi:hypothetical protein
MPARGGSVFATLTYPVRASSSAVRCTPGHAVAYTAR